MRVTAEIVLTAEELAELGRLAESGDTPARITLRARMVLLAAQGMQNQAIAARLGVGRVQVARWRERYVQFRLVGIETSEMPSTSSADATPSLEARPLMPRDALMAQLLDARGRRCIVIQGQAGSGKTSTMVTWRHVLLTSHEVDVAWFSLSVQDDELTRFLQGMLASIAQVDPAIVREAAMLTGRESDDAWLEHWVIALVQGFAKRRREFVLMIEDLHHIEDRRIFQALQWLLDYAPEHVHYVFCSRNALQLSLERLRSQDMLAELDMRDLRFSIDETARYLREQLGSPIGAEQVRALHELTDGWVAGLQLFALDLRARRGAPHMPVEVRDAEAFSSYFEREVLVRLAPEDLNMLTRTAICQRLCAPLCAALMGQPHGASRIAARLDRLQLDNFFITQVDAEAGGSETWYRPHPLLRETLLARLAKHSEEERRALHQAASTWFAACGELGTAVDHAVQAGALADAADMVQACGHSLLSRGKISELMSLLRRLPREQVEQRFELHVLMAYLHMYGRNTDALEKCLRRMQAQAETLDEHQRYYLVLLHSAAAVQRDDHDTVIRLLPAVLDIPPRASDLAWSNRSNVLSWVHIGQGEYEAARRVFDEGEGQSGAPRSSLLGRCMTAMSLAQQGQARQAEQILREVLRTADQHGVPFVGVACMAVGVLGEILREVDDMEAVRSLLVPRILVLERVSLPDVVLLGLLALSEALWWDGQVDEAVACIDRLEAYARGADIHRLDAEALLARLRFHLRQGETQLAIATLERLDALASLYADDAGTLPGKIGLVAAQARVEMALWTQDLRAAAQGLEPLLAQLEAAGSALRKAEALLQSAIVQQGLGNLAAAREQALAAVRLGHQLGLIRTLLNVSPGIPAMLQDLRRAQALDPVLEFYVRRLEAAAVRTQSQPGAQAETAVHPADTLSGREYEVLTLLAQAMPNKKIAKVIHVSPDTVKFHLKNIYAKLGVSARDEAVARLRDHIAQQTGTAVP